MLARSQIQVRSDVWIEQSAFSPSISGRRSCVADG